MLGLVKTVRFDKRLKWMFIFVSSNMLRALPARLHTQIPALHAGSDAR